LLRCGLVGSALKEVQDFSLVSTNPDLPLFIDLNKL
jgi:hypothetical protein